MRIINNIVFLCHEMTKGMKSFGPKALIPVGKNHPQPLIIKQIAEIKKQYENMPHKIHVVVGFEYEKILKVLKHIPDVNIIITHNYDQINNAGVVLNFLESFKNGNCLFIENGIVCSQKIYHNNHSIIPVLNKTNKQTEFNIGVTSSNNTAEYLFYDLIDKWCEILFINNNDIGSIISASKERKIDQMFMFEYINYLIDSNILFHTTKVYNNKILKILNHKISKNVNLHTK